MGNSVAGGESTTSPSIRTVNVSGSTSIRGSASLWHVGLGARPDVRHRLKIGRAPDVRRARRRERPGRRTKVTSWRPLLGQRPTSGAAGSAAAWGSTRWHRPLRPRQSCRLSARCRGVHRKTADPTALGRRACLAPPSPRRRRCHWRRRGRWCISRRSAGPARCQPRRPRAASRGCASSCVRLRPRRPAGKRRSRQASTPSPHAA